VKGKLIIEGTLNALGAAVAAHFAAAEVPVAAARSASDARR
jgi:hypothetical protein